MSTNIFGIIELFLEACRKTFLYTSVDGYLRDNASFSNTILQFSLEITKVPFPLIWFRSSISKKECLFEMLTKFAPMAWDTKGDSPQALRAINH